MTQTQQPPEWCKKAAEDKQSALEQNWKQISSNLKLIESLQEDLAACQRELDDANRIMAQVRELVEAARRLSGEATYVKRENEETLRFCVGCGNEQDNAIGATESHSPHCPVIRLRRALEPFQESNPATHNLLDKENPSGKVSITQCQTRRN